METKGGCASLGTREPVRAGTDDIIRERAAKFDNIRMPGLYRAFALGMANLGKVIIMIHL
jgi:hypothetical protein